jgi:N-acetyl sugar amidotransferase
MDTSDPEITFDLGGRCCHCAAFLEKRSKYGYQGIRSDQVFERLIADVKRAGRGRPYDCVIGISGGVDSSYLAHVTKQRGLRALAVHMDNGWDSEKAVSNIKTIASTLGFDYESYVLDWEEFKDLQLAFLRASIPEAETPTDVAIPAALHHFAAKYNVKYILSGGNLVTEGILPKCWHYDVKDLRYFKHIHRTYGKRRLRTFPTFDYKKETYYKLIKGIRTVYPLDHVAFDKEKAVGILTSEFGWKDYGGKHHESRYTKFIQSYYLVEKFNIDYRRVGLSLRICEGTITRDEANEQLKCNPYDRDEVATDKEYIAKKLSISRSDLEEIVSAKPKWYWEFPNNEAKLGLIYNTYRRVYGKEKLDRF